jgi:hypothetical protein
LEDVFLTPSNTISQTWPSSKAGWPAFVRKVPMAVGSNQQKSQWCFYLALSKNISEEAKGFFFHRGLFQRNGDIKTF